MQGSRFDQTSFFEELAEIIPRDTKLVAVVAELLQLDQSNAYRRIRGDKELTLHEYLKIADQMPEARRIMARIVDEDHIDVQISRFRNLAEFEKYLYNTATNLKRALGKPHLLRYMARDLPLFAFFSGPDLMRFKIQVWFESGNVPMQEELPETIMNLGAELYEIYQQLNTVEIWYENGFLNQLEQIQYWRDLEYLTDAQHESVIRDLTACFDQYKVWLEQGEKQGGGSLEILASSFSTMSDGGLMAVGEHRELMTRVQGIHQLHSSHPDFVELFEDHWQAHSRLATPIMGSNTRSRHLFFRRIKEQLKQYA